MWSHSCHSLLTLIPTYFEVFSFFLLCVSVLWLSWLPCLSPFSSLLHCAALKGSFPIYGQYGRSDVLLVFCLHQWFSMYFTLGFFFFLLPWCWFRIILCCIFKTMGVFYSFNFATLSLNAFSWWSNFTLFQNIIISSCYFFWLILRAFQKLQTAHGSWI